METVIQAGIVGNERRGKINCIALLRASDFIRNEG